MTHEERFENEVEYPEIKILEETDLWLIVSILDVKITFARFEEVLSSDNMLALHDDPLKYGLTRKNKKLQDLLKEWKKRVTARGALVKAVNDTLKRSGRGAEDEKD